MNMRVRIGLVGGAGAASALLLVAARPAARACAGERRAVGSQPSAPAARADASCASPIRSLLGQWEHRGDALHARRSCPTSGNKTVINYTCADGGFGRSEMTLLTPRSLRVDTQGISGGLPFDYVAPCAPRRAIAARAVKRVV